MQPDPTELLERMDMTLPLVGFYDAPDPQAFEPLVIPGDKMSGCVFAAFEHWIDGKTLHITRERFGCGGAGYWLCGIEGRSREDFIDFLVDAEGLKSSRELMSRWIDASRPYEIEKGHIMIGPLEKDQYDHCKSVTFFVNADQLSLLTYGANYDAAPEDPAPIIAPFGSGCSQLLPMFDSLDAAQAVLGATDVAMRSHVPAGIIAFTVTISLFERLCALDERSFLYKPFWRNLRKSRGLPDFE